MFNTKRKFWGWGNDDYALPTQLADLARYYLAAKFNTKPQAAIPVPTLEQIQLPPSKLTIPQPFANLMTDARYDRAAHTYGKAFRDVVRALSGDFSAAPDLVAYPQTEQDVVDMLAFAQQENWMIIPFGGGSSVCGGIEADATLRGNYAGVVSLDLCHLNQVLEIDKASRTARIQGGVYGPHMEAQLKEHGYSMRHFPQSFEFSTLGGWIATRAGGHFATLYTHIDDFVESVRMVTPSGIMQTRRLPGNGAGPEENRLILGSEGVLGVITEAWMRVQDLPVYRAGCTVTFDSFEAGVAACRSLAQSGLYPANARLIEADEALFMGAGDGQSHLLVLAFESAYFPQKDKLEAAIGLCEQQGGKARKIVVRNNENDEGDKNADQWKQSFLRAPYLRDEIARAGFITETFETCTTWQNFAAYDKAIRDAAHQAIKEQCGTGMITCRFTHLYPDGPAPYYTILAPGTQGKQLEQWDAIKKAVSDALIKHGGTITHHHAVGKDHRPWYLQQNDPLSIKMLRAAKQEVDPKGIMNSGTLL